MFILAGVHSRLQVTSRSDTAFRKPSPGAVFSGIGLAGSAHARTVPAVSRTLDSFSCSHIWLRPEHSTIVRKCCSASGDRGKSPEFLVQLFGWRIAPHKRKNAGAPMHTTSVSHFQELPAAEPNRAAEASAVVCKDCKSSLPLGSLVPVDALHVQCPQCLFVFFFEPGMRRQL